MTTGERTDPYLAARYQVQLDELIVAGFTTVEGLEVELETEAYEEGGTNAYTHTLPTRVSHGTVTLARGVGDSDELWTWMQAGIEGPPERKTGQIILQNASGESVRGWEFRDGFPVRWEGPELAADRSDIAIERLEIAHHGLEQYEI